MKDLPIGTIFEHPTKGKLIVVATPDNSFMCDGCIFSNPLFCTNDPDKIHTGSCSKDGRIDKTNVIFIKSKI